MVLLTDPKGSFEDDVAYQFIEHVQGYLSSLELASIESIKGRLSVGGFFFGKSNVPAIYITVKEGKMKRLGGYFFIITEGNTHTLNLIKEVTLGLSDLGSLKDMTDPKARIQKIQSSLSTIDEILEFSRFNSLLNVVFDSAIEATKKFS